MIEKNKKYLLFFFLAVFIFFVSLFLPFTSLDYSDVLRNNGYEKPDVYWKISDSLIFHSYGVYDFSENGEQLKYEFYRFQYSTFYFYETGDMKFKDTFSGRNYYEKATRKENNPFSTGIMPMVYYTFYIIGITIFVYFCYKGFKNFDVDKNKYFLYLGLLIIAIHISWLISIYYAYDFQDVNNLGYTSGMNFDIGFYTLIFSGILFFVLYILKNYLLKNSKLN